MTGSPIDSKPKRKLLLLAAMISPLFVMCLLASLCDSQSPHPGFTILADGYIDPQTNVVEYIDEIVVRGISPWLECEILSTSKDDFPSRYAIRTVRWSRAILNSSWCFLVSVLAVLLFQRFKRGGQRHT
jgi:hypothetical protein